MTARVGSTRRFRRRAAALLAVLWCQAPPAQARVILSEVLADPAGSEHHEEFVELRNTGAESVDLAGWRLGDAQELDALVDAGSGTRLAAGAFAVVVDGSYRGNSAAYDSVQRWAGILTIEDRSFGRAGWSNSAPETVLLRDARGAVADSFTYDPSAGTAGHSWERQGAKAVRLAGFLPRRRHPRAGQQRRPGRGSRRPHPDRGRAPSPSAAASSSCAASPRRRPCSRSRSSMPRDAGSRDSPTGAPPPSRRAWPGTDSTPAGVPPPRGCTWSSRSPAPAAASPAASGS